MEAIFARTSVRKYQDRPVPEEEITRLLQAAMQAPSAGNQMPWEFIVLRDRETLTGITEVHPFSGMLRHAPCAIVVCGNTGRSRFPEDYWVQDCSAATENLLLEATHLGLGAVWLGVYPLEDRVTGIQRLLTLPESIVPLAVVSLGYPDEELNPKDSYLPNRIHWDKWDGQKD